MTGEVSPIEIALAIFGVALIIGTLILVPLIEFWGVDLQRK